MSEPSSKREEIIRVAQSLIIAGGYNAFSYADISKVVGIQNASIHHHFPSKVDLVVAARCSSTEATTKSTLEGK